MREAITDTGPVLHLNEIGRLECLRIFEHLVMPDLVAEELRAYGLDPSHLGVMALKVTIVIVERTEWSPVLSKADQPMGCGRRRPCMTIRWGTKTRRGCWLIWHVH
jgi:hypothetical protein